jgi:tetratricopeptide (TPR) repeat protein
MNARTVLVLAATVAAALIAWPAFVQSHFTAQSAGSSPVWTPAPVIPDYANRDALVAAYEGDARRNPQDQIVAQMLAGQYLLRYRERADAGDLLRAENEAKRSLRLQPRFNFSADMEMASVLLSFHRMRDALAYADEAARITPTAFGPRAMIANLQMESGNYGAAKNELTLRPSNDDQVWDVALARYDELTGHLSSARALIDGVARQVDEVVDNPAESRAWAHWRQGELAFLAGDSDGAVARYDEALAIFPGYWHAYNGLAKTYWGRRDWERALDAATKGANAYPLPETLGYKYDAQRALGDRAGAAQTLDLIYAIERIGNTQGINDRLRAMFYADHGLRKDDAVAIARRDLARRDDVYAEDALAWTLASAGRWREARPHAEAAVRLGTEDAKLQYHAGLIALHCGERLEARRRLELALSLNPHFHPFEADDARGILHDSM